jgi:hypothetical protein
VELFGNVISECYEPAIDKQKEPKSGQNGTKEGTARFQDIQPNNLKTDTDEQKQINDCLIARYTGQLAGFTKWLVGVTGLLALFGFWQVTISRNTAKRQLRAYVVIEGGVVVKATVKDSPGFYLHIELKNAGLTPGYEFATWHRAQICDLTKPPKFIRTGGLTGQNFSIIGPGSGANLDWYGVFADSDLAAIRTRSKGIFAWGNADYVDTFGTKRHFTFRCMMTGHEDHQGRWALTPYKGYEAN